MLPVVQIYQTGSLNKQHRGCFNIDKSFDSRKMAAFCGKKNLHIFFFNSLTLEKKLNHKM